jgi:hypothetical protein
MCGRSALVRLTTPAFPTSDFEGSGDLSRRVVPWSREGDLMTDYWQSKNPVTP